MGAKGRHARCQPHGLKRLILGQHPFPAAALTAPKLCQRLVELFFVLPAHHACFAVCALLLHMLVMYGMSHRASTQS